MDWLINLFTEQAGSQIAYTLVIGILTSAGVLKLIAKYIVKVPMLKLRSGLEVAKETLDVLDATQKATDEKGDGGGDITEAEMVKIYKELRELGKAVGILRKRF